VSPGLIDVFSGSSKEFKEFLEFQENFDLGRFEEVILARSSGFRTEENIAALADFVVELQLFDGVSNVFSIFSLTSADDETPYIGNPRFTSLAHAVTELRKDIPLARHLLDPNHQATLIYVVSPDADGAARVVAGLSELRPIFPDLQLTLVGQAEVDRTVASVLLADQAIIAPIAALFSVLASILIFRSWRAAICCAVPPLVALVWFLACLANTNTPVDPFLTIVPTIIVVLGFSDSVHLYFATTAARKHSDARSAIRSGMAQTVPAAAMTSATTALAFISFAVVGTDAVVKFAFWGPLGLALAFLAFVAVFPVAYLGLSLGRGRDEVRFVLFLKVAGELMRYKSTMRVLALLLLIGLLPFMGKANAVFSLDEQIPQRSELKEDLDYLRSARLANANIYLVYADQDSVPGLSRQENRELEILKNIALGQSAMPLPKEIFSDPGSRFVSRDGTKYAIPFPLPLSSDADDIIRRVDDVEARIASENIAGDVTITGHSLLAAKLVPQIINDMRLAFYTAFAGVTALLWASLRSIRLAILASLVSVLPVLGVEAVLALSGKGVNMIGSISLSIAFGIAVDDTIHFLHKFRATSGRPAEAVRQSLTSVGQPMVATTLVLVAGLAATAFSSVPSIPTSGFLLSFAILLALVADLLLLPSLVEWAIKT
jgi:predicted RND superfamily exporter protein